MSGSGCWIRRTRARASRAFEGEGEYPLQERSLVVLVTRKPEENGQTVTAVRGQERPDSHGEVRRANPARAVADLSRSRDGSRRRESTMNLTEICDRVTVSSDGRGRAPAAARVDLPLAVSRRIHVPRCAGDRALPARPGHHPLLRIALSEGPARQHARLRHHRSRCAQPGNRHDAKIMKQWVSALHDNGMGQILDTVPNHMGVGTNDNPWWNDVLENGPASRICRLLRHRLAVLAPAGAA